MMCNVDIIIIISNNIKELEKNSNLNNCKFKHIPIYIITGNLKTNNIVSAINLTNYISYIKNTSERIVKKSLQILRLHERR